MFDRLDLLRAMLGGTPRTDAEPDARVAAARVLVSVEDGPWQTHAASFTDYVHALTWDILAPTEYTLTAPDVPLSEADLDLLRSRFHEGVSTYGWPPGSRDFRFERPGQRKGSGRRVPARTRPLRASNLES